MTAYLDWNATSPVSPSVFRVMEPWLTGRFGNPSSRDHQHGWDAMAAVEEARGYVSDVLGASPGEIVFTGNATEAINTVLRSYVGFGSPHSKTIVASDAEHDSVLTTAKHLSLRTGVHLTILPVDRVGRINVRALEEALASSPGALVALTAANNEIGTLNPVREYASLIESMGGTFLCDTAQGVGKVAVDARADRLHYSILSAHKIGGPQGVGALSVRADRHGHLDPLIIGGGQEHGKRGGTLNVPGIVGCGEACRLVRDESSGVLEQLDARRNHLDEGIRSQVSGTWINGDVTSRLCNTTNIGFAEIDARALIRDMHDIAVSTRSACSSGNSGPSHVLKAIGLSDEDAYSCVRFSLGRLTTQDEIDYAIHKVVSSVHKLRRLKSVRV